YLNDMIGSKPASVSGQFDTTTTFSGNYEMSVMGAASSMGNENKSTLFIGNNFFTKQDYSDFGKIEFQDVIIKADRNAQRYFSGYEGIDSKVLAEKINSKEVSPQTVYTVGELDAHLYCLRQSPISGSLPVKLRNYHERQAALNLAQIAVRYSSASSFEKHFIDVFLRSQGINVIFDNINSNGQKDRSLRNKGVAF
ncbi:MAG TPA: hypothetical protein VHA12_03305, partial [Candidatus Nanoarchaeia archaeon]|nr:hypothetical protein [Candidatus Nanoarchaeia archaeon]